MNGPSSYPLISPATRKGTDGVSRIRTESHIGDLVAVPFRYGHAGVTSTNYYEGEFGGMAAHYGSYIMMLSTAADWVTDNTQTAYFRGRALGILFDPGQTANASPTFFKGLSVLIDRVAYRVPKPVWNPWNQAVETAANGDYGSIITTDLADGPHLLEFGIRSDTSNSNQSYFWGLLLEKRAGYHETARYSVACAPFAVATGSYAGVGTNFSTNKRTPRGISKLFYSNTTGGGSVTVTLRLYNTDFYTFALAVGASTVIDFPTALATEHYLSGSTAFTHKASGSGVVCVAVGE